MPNNTQFRWWNVVVVWACGLAVGLVAGWVGHQRLTNHKPADTPLPNVAIPSDIHVFSPHGGHTDLRVVAVHRGPSGSPPAPGVWIISTIDRHGERIDIEAADDHP